MLIIRHEGMAGCNAHVVVRSLTLLVKGHRYLLRTAMGVKGRHEEAFSADP